MKFYSVWKHLYFNVAFSRLEIVFFFCFFLFSCYFSKASVEKYLLCMKNFSPIRYGVYLKVFMHWNSWWLSVEVKKYRWLRSGCSQVVRKFFNPLWDFSKNLQILTQFWVNKCVLYLYNWPKEKFYTQDWHIF